MRKGPKRSISDIFAAGGEIQVGNSTNNYWSNDSGDGATDATSSTAVNPIITNNTNTTDNNTSSKSDKSKNLVNGIAAGAGVVSSLLDSTSDGQYRGGRDHSAGHDLLTGHLEGFQVGSQYGGWIGGIIGAGVIGTNKFLKNIHKMRMHKKELGKQEKDMQAQYGRNVLDPNIDKYGNTFEDGGMTSGPEQPIQAAPEKLINVEKGEIMVNPMDMTIVQKFLNPNRFSSHQKSEMKEPVGNFVSLPDGHVIIPKKLAPRYEKGDMLTRKSIVMQLLSDQATDPYHNVREEDKPDIDENGEAGETFAMGGMTDGPGKRKKRGNKTIPNNYGMYNGIVDDNGNYISDPTDIEAVQTMARYMQNNASDQSSSPSNNYHKDKGWEHHSTVNMPMVPVAGKGMFTGPDDPLPQPKGKRKKSVQEMIATSWMTPESKVPEDEKLPLTVSDMVENNAYDTKMQRGPLTTHVFPGYQPETPISTTNSPEKKDVAADGTVTTNKGKKFNVNSTLRGLIQNAPIIAQMANNGSDPYLHRNVNSGYNEAISLATQLPEEIDVSANLAANDRSYLMGLKTIDQNDTPSVRAEKGQLLAEKFAGDNSVYQGKENAGIQLKSTKLQQLLGLTERQGADWQADDNRLSNEYRMDAAARDNNEYAAMANLSENLMLGQNDQEKIKALNAITHTIDIDPFAKDIIKEDPGFVPFIYNYIFSGKGDYLAAKNEYLTGKKDKDKTTAYSKTVTKEGNQTVTTGTKREKTK